MITVEQVINALKAWEIANRIAIAATELPSVPQEELHRLWGIEEAALEAYTTVYNDFWCNKPYPTDRATSFANWLQQAEEMAQR